MQYNVQKVQDFTRTTSDAAGNWNRWNGCHIMFLFVPFTMTTKMSLLQIDLLALRIGWFLKIFGLCKLGLNLLHHVREVCWWIRETSMWSFAWWWPRCTVRWKPMLNMFFGIAILVGFGSWHPGLYLPLFGWRVRNDLKRGRGIFQNLFFRSWDFVQLLLDLYFRAST